MDRTKTSLGNGIGFVEIKNIPRIDSCKYITCKTLIAVWGF
jgi:hypothetical protein